MGFRDLTLFNDSLIAKQAWQLMHKIDTLFYRIFKIGFSLNVHLWKQKIQPLGHMLGKIFFKVDVIKRGSKFRVSNAKNIWQHHWLPISFPLSSQPWLFPQSLSPWRMQQLIA